MKSGGEFKKKSVRHWDSMSTVWAGAGAVRKRGLRILPRDEGYFVHVCSRTVGQAFIFGDTEKKVFVKMMRKWADFSGLSVITHCLMDNHFHLMLWVPGKVTLDHRGVLTRLESVWPEEKVMAWDRFYQKQGTDVRASMDLAVVERMANLPEFMRVLKQTFTRWYNGKHERTGTLWDSRYRSVVVEGSPLALMSVAAYIDLNPLRAGMVNDPMAYAWSGYGDAMGGDKKAREGLTSLVRLTRGHQPHAARSVRRKQVADKVLSWQEIAPVLAKEFSQRAAPKNWQEVQAAYRVWLVSKGTSKPENAGKEKFSIRKGMDPVQVLATYEQQGAVPVSAQLHCRLRAFTRGVAVGSDGYLAKLLQNYRGCFGPHRKQAGRKLKGMGKELMSLRQVG